MLPVNVALKCALWMVTVLNSSLFLLTSVSRIPLREDPSPDINPPPWADRSVAARWQKIKSYLAADGEEIPQMFV